ncbi:sugar phosphate permease [Ureibacillus chungkukjangi]|uniref:Sugar phosphate permease n=2 Tax=Ureibacillus chungkukjangi TaxID=1202712 RepID=A0A318TWA4_9BACL|nr:sugar phosphate permease [Ureibacillus chungkukjangi]
MEGTKASYFYFEGIKAKGAENLNARLPRQKGIIVLLFLGWFISSVDRMFINIAILPIGKELEMDAATFGIVLSIFYLGYTLMQIPGGLIADRYGSKTAIIVTILAFSLFAGLSGVAWSVTSLLVIRFFFGLGEGAFPGAATKLMSENVSPEKRTSIQSVLLVAIVLGGFVASIAGAYFITQIGWRNVYICLGIMGVITALLFMLFLRSDKTGPTDIKQQEGEVSFVSLLKSPSMWKIMVALFGLYTAIWGLTSWVPSYLMNVRKLNLLDTGIYSSLPAIAGMIGYLVGGWLVDKVFVNRERLLIIYGNLLSAICIFGMFNVESLTMTIIFQNMAACFLQIAYMGVLAVPLRMLPSSVMGSAFGMINTGANLAAFITPAVMGSLIQLFNGSYSIAFSYLIVGTILSLIMGLLLGNVRNDFVQNDAGTKTA